MTSASRPVDQQDGVSKQKRQVEPGATACPVPGPSLTLASPKSKALKKEHSKQIEDLVHIFTPWIPEPKCKSVVLTHTLPLMASLHPARVRELRKARWCAEGFGSTQDRALEGRQFPPHLEARREQGTHFLSAREW